MIRYFSAWMIIICVRVLCFLPAAESESLAEYDQPTVDPGIFVFDDEELSSSKEEEAKDDPNGVISQKDGDCVEEGRYYTNPTDCSLFYLCQNRRRYEFQCNPGLGFDSQKQSCNWLSSLAENCLFPETGDCPSLKYLADPRDKSLFYRCHGKRRFQFKCPVGLIFNPKWSICQRAFQK